MFDPSKLADMMRQAQQMQQQLQDDLRTRTVEGQAGGGLVAVKMNGMLEVQAVHLDPKVVDKGDIPLLEDLIRAALAQAISRVEEVRAENAQKMAGAMGLPGGMF